MKGLEALKQITHHITFCEQQIGIKKEDWLKSCKEQLKYIEKELKAFEVLKKIFLNDYRIVDNAIIYNEEYYKYLPQETIILLKEVLKNE